MKKLLTALVGLMLMATVDAYAISKSKYMTKAMDAFVGHPEYFLFAKLGHTKKVQTYKDGIVAYQWGTGLCSIEAVVKDGVVQSWTIDGKWKHCWGRFVGLYDSKWPNSKWPDAVPVPWTDPPTEVAKAAPVLLRSIVGKWRGSGTSAGGTSYMITYIFGEDGSFKVSWRTDPLADWNRRQYPAGALRVNGSHFEYKTPDDLLWTITLHKDQDQYGQRRLMGRREDGSTLQLKELWTGDLTPKTTPDPKLEFISRLGGQVTGV